MKTFQLECLIYLLILVLLIILAVKELREIIAFILYTILCKPILLGYNFFKTACKPVPLLHNPIENYNDINLELSILGPGEGYKGEYESL